MKITRRLPAWKVCERDTICQREVYEKGYRFCQEWCIKGSDLEVEPPRIEFILIPPSPQGPYPSDSPFPGDRNESNVVSLPGKGAKTGLSIKSCFNQSDKGLLISARDC